MVSPEENFCRTRCIKISPTDSADVQRSSCYDKRAIPFNVTSMRSTFLIPFKPLSPFLHRVAVLATPS